jgi:prepilin-type N-terminal cleavage/methylation domain-containing protein
MQNDECRMTKREKVVRRGKTCRARRPSSFCIHHSSFIIRRAFTLLELMAVMMVLAILLAMVAPSLGGFGAGRKADEAAANLVSLARWARDQAVAEGRPYRLNFDPANRVYYVTAAVGGAWQSPPVEFGRPFTLPDNVAVEWKGPQEGGAYYAEFYPTGRCEPVHIKVIARDGQWVDLACLSAAEPLKVVTPQELASL